MRFILDSKSSTSVLYIWFESNSEIGVLPPGIQNPMWRLWLERQDANKRRLISQPPPGYWLLSVDLLPKLKERCITLGWLVDFQRPSHIFIESTKKVTDPFSIFYLQQNAPREIVDVVYRYLIKQVHTDLGGDQELAILYNNAKDEIYKLKDW